MLLMMLFTEGFSVGETVIHLPIGSTSHLCDRMNCGVSFQFDHFNNGIGVGPSATSETGNLWFVWHQSQKIVQSPFKLCDAYVRKLRTSFGRALNRRAPCIGRLASRNLLNLALALDTGMLHLRP